MLSTECNGWLARFLAAPRRAVFGACSCEVSPVSRFIQELLGTDKCMDGELRQDADDDDNVDDADDDAAEEVLFSAFIELSYALTGTTQSKSAIISLLHLLLMLMLRLLEPAGGTARFFSSARHKLALSCSVLVLFCPVLVLASNATWFVDSLPPKNGVFLSKQQQGGKRREV